MAWLSEAGVLTAADPVQSLAQGQVEEITLKISAVDKAATGYQLAVTLPDKATEASWEDFYGSVLNGGAVNDQKGFDFGNETDGCYYAGSCWMYGMALAAGTPAPGPRSAHPYDAASPDYSRQPLSSAYAEQAWAPLQLAQENARLRAGVVAMDRERLVDQGDTGSEAK